MASSTSNWVQYQHAHDPKKYASIHVYSTHCHAKTPTGFGKKNWMVAHWMVSILLWNNGQKSKVHVLASQKKWSQLSIGSAALRADYFKQTIWCLKMSCDRRSPVDKTCLLENSSLAECWEYVVAPVPVQVPRARVQQSVKKPIMLMALIMAIRGPSETNTYQ